MNTVTWYITDGNLPFLNEFPIRYDAQYTSDALWQIDDGSLPYKKPFPQLTGFTDSPNKIWFQQDGELPYKLSFPEMYPFVPFSRGFSNVIHREEKIKTMYLEDTGIKKAYLGDISVFSYAQPVGT